MLNGVLRGLVRVGIAAALLSLLLSRAHAENLPEAPSPHVHNVMRVATPPVSRPLLTRSELRDGAELLAVNLGDWWTTEHFLAHGGKEGELPTALVDNKAGFLVFKLAEAAGEIYLERRVDRMRYSREHKWFRVASRIGVQAAVAGMAYVDAKNYVYAENLRPIETPSLTLTQPTRPPLHVSFGGAK